MAEGYATVATIWTLLWEAASRLQELGACRR
jgi:hypothetical protein